MRAPGWSWGAEAGEGVLSRVPSLPGGNERSRGVRGVARGWEGSRTSPEWVPPLADTNWYYSHSLRHVLYA